MNDEFKTEPDGGTDPFRLWALARQLDCYAVAIDHLKREGAPRAVNRAWGDIAERMNAFAEEVKDCLPLTLKVTVDDLRGLATYSTRHSRRPHLYLTIFLFLLNEYEIKPQLLLQAREWMPTSEQPMLNEIAKRKLVPLLTDRAFEESPESDPHVRKAKWGFAYREVERETFERFFQKFRSEKDNCAHFIGYRSARSHPDSLIKSFLAIRAPAAHDLYTFAHFYRVPSIGAQNRVSAGFVLPLQHGTYLIGGQLHMEEGGRRHAPFRTLEVTALSNTDIGVPEPLLEGLLLSSNYDDDHIITKMALKATPIYHSTKFDRPLDKIPIKDLVKDIDGDLATERRLSKKSYVGQPAERQAEEILRITNNVTSRWHVPSDFRPKGGKPGAKALSEALVVAKLEEMFGSDQNPQYVSATTKRAFSFWQHLRFSAISRE